MGGFNNNPNVVQLEQAMRRLTLHNFISPSATGNSAPQGNDGDDGLLRIRRPQRQQSEVNDLDGVTNSTMPTTVQLLLRSGNAGSSFSDSCVTYISGYVCRKLFDARNIRCAECIGALLCNVDDPPPEEVMGLVKVRDNGGLLVPSASTHAIVTSAERHLTALAKCGEIARPKLVLSIQCSVLKQLTSERSNQLFPGSQEHMFQPRAGECHFVVVVKLVVERYLRVRLHSWGRLATLRDLRSVHVRHSLHKQVLFANQ